MTLIYFYVGWSLSYSLTLILIRVASLVIKALYLFIAHGSLLTFYCNQAKDRICKLVQNGVDSGARLLLDGRDIVVISILHLFIRLPVVLLYIRCVHLVSQPTSQHYCSLILNQHQPPATSQSAVLFSHNKSAPAISHSQVNTAIVATGPEICEMCRFRSLRMAILLVRPFWLMLKMTWSVTR